MSIADELNKVVDELTEAYDAMEEMGGTVPAEKNYKNLRIAIESISGEPAEDWGTLYYMENGKEVSQKIETQEDYNALGAGYSDNLVVAGKTIPKNTVTGYIFGNSIVDVPFFFLYNCKILTRLENLENTKITEIKAYFLAECPSFNQQINLPNSVTTIGDYFMNGCSQFNKPLSLPESITSIGISFLANCSAFDQSVKVPPSVTTIENHFLSGCTSLNQPVTLPSGLTAIGGYFMQICSSFSQPLTLPDTITSIGSYFLYNSDNFVGPLNVGRATGHSSSTYILSTTNASARMYAVGVTLTGTNASAWKAGLPDTNTSPYRKLIVA